MPAVSGSPTQQSTSAGSVAELESIEVDQFKSGDLAAVTVAGVTTTYLLSTGDTTARNGTSVLYTRNSNPAYVGAANGSTPGRWLRTNLTEPV